MKCSVPVYDTDSQEIIYRVAFSKPHSQIRFLNISLCLKSINSSTTHILSRAVVVNDNV